MDLSSTGLIGEKNQILVHMADQFMGVSKAQRAALCNTVIFKYILVREYPLARPRSSRSSVKKKWPEEKNPDVEKPIPRKLAWFLLYEEPSLYSLNITLSEPRSPAISIVHTRLCLYTIFEMGRYHKRRSAKAELRESTVWSRPRAY